MTARAQVGPVGGDRDRRVRRRPAGGGALVADPRAAATAGSPPPARRSWPPGPRPGWRTPRSGRAGPRRSSRPCCTPRPGGDAGIDDLWRWSQSAVAAKRRPRGPAGPGRPRHRRRAAGRTGVGGHPGPGRRRATRSSAATSGPASARPWPGWTCPRCAAGSTPDRARTSTPRAFLADRRAPCICWPRPTTRRPGCCSAWSPTSPAPPRSSPTAPPRPGSTRR